MYNIRRNITYSLNYANLKEKYLLYKCQFCFKRFTHAYSLNQHIHTHTKEKSYICQITKKENLNVHTKVHSIINIQSVKFTNRPFECPICKIYSANNLINLKIHINKKHI